jgi:hypothetical protein
VSVGRIAAFGVGRESLPNIGDRAAGGNGCVSVLPVANPGLLLVVYSTAVSRYQHHI